MPLPGYGGIRSAGLFCRGALALATMLLPAVGRAQRAATEARSALAPLAGPPATWADGESVDGCASLYGNMVALDTIALELAIDSSCAPLTIEMVSAGRLPLPQFRVGGSSDRVAVTLQVRNLTGVALRAPLYLYVRDGVLGTVAGRRLPGGLTGMFVNSVSFAADGWLYQRGDLPPPGRANVSMSRTPGPALTEIDSLATGQVSSTVHLVIAVRPNTETFRVPLSVRALRASPLIPREPPLLLPGDFLAPDRLISVDSVPQPFARDLIRVRFKAESPWEVRQRVVDRIRGRVVGGLAGPDGVRDYVIQVADRDGGWAVFECWRQLGQLGFGVSRRGVVMVQGTPAAVAESGPFPQLAGADLLNATGVVVDFAADADSIERLSTIALAGGRIKARLDGFLGDYLATAAEASRVGLERLASRLRYLAGVSDVRARIHLTANADLDRGPLDTPWSGHVPSDSGQSAADPVVRRFVRRLDLPSVRSIVDLAYLPREDLLFFSVIYGQPMEVYPSVVGIRHGRSVSLFLSRADRPAQVEDTTRDWSRFISHGINRVLADSQLLDRLEGLHESLYSYLVLPALLDDSLVARSVLRRCIRGIYANRGWCTAPTAVAIARRLKDLGALTQLRFIREPFWFSDSTVRAVRRALRELAPVALRQQTLPRASLLALAEAAAEYPGDSRLITRLLRLPAATRDAGIVVIMCEARPWVQVQLLRLLPADARIARVLQSLCPRYPSTPEVRHEDVVALLDDPILGHDVSVLRLIANAPVSVHPEAAEAARRLPRNELTRHSYLLEPPRLP